MPTHNFRELLEVMPAARQQRIEKRFQKSLAIGYSARKTAATGTCRVSRIGTARRGFTFPARDRAVRRGWPMARTWRWLGNRAGLESESGAAGTH
jgi:hypothetical protein